MSDMKGIIERVVGEHNDLIKALPTAQSAGVGGMKKLDLVKAQLYSEMSKSPYFGADSHELCMAHDFLLGIKSEIESCMALVKDPRLDSTKIELMGFDVVIDDTLKEFEFRLKP